MTEFYLPSHGKGRIHCMQWTPPGQPRAVVQLVHGIAEYVARYDSFARFLNRQGFLVVGEDHMGHGGSLAPGDPPGYFHGGWNAAVDDTYALLQKTHGECPQLPYVILGHSMGSFLTRTLLCRHLRHRLAAGCRPENRAGYVPPRLSKAWRDPGL